VRTKHVEKTRVGLWGQSTIFKALWGVIGNTKVEFIKNIPYVVYLRNVLEQNEFNITLKSFDNNKVLKNCQLDMLIIVQVYRTIDKKFEIINRF